MIFKLPLLKKLVSLGLKAIKCQFLGTNLSSCRRQNRRKYCFNKLTVCLTTLLACHFILRCLVYRSCQVADRMSSTNSAEKLSTANVMSISNGSGFFVPRPPGSATLLQQAPALDENFVLPISTNSKTGALSVSSVTLSGNAGYTTALAFGQQQKPGYIFDCKNIGKIRIKHKLGHGVTKHVYLGLYPTEAAAMTSSSSRVAVKMVTRNAVDMTSCLAKLGSGASRPRDDRDTENTARRKRCQIQPNMKLMKEILLHDQLRHPGLIPLLGYCVRSEETDSTSLIEHGVVGVYAYGQRFYTGSMVSWPLRKRLVAARQLADLLAYFADSPLGSLRISDFKESHFLMHDGSVVMTDLDDVTSVEPPCSDRRLAASWRGNIELELDDALRCKSYGLKCRGGQCVGYNALHNMDRMTQLYFNRLLHDDCRHQAAETAPGHVADDLATNRCSCSVGQRMASLRSQLNHLQLEAGHLVQILDNMHNTLIDCLQRLR